MLDKRENRRTILKLGGVAAAAGLLPGSQRAFGQSSTPSSGTPVAGESNGALTVYSGQHEELSLAFADAFAVKTGVSVNVRSGKDSDLANQITEEGKNSSADVFMTEEPGPAATLDEQGLLSPVDPATLEKTDHRFNPEDGHWLAFAARSRAIFYNPELIDEADLPKSVFDLVEDSWKGTFAYAPSGAFTSTVTYLVNTIGEDETLSWLQGIEQNGENLLKNGAIRDAVEAGQISFGLSNHYYWYILAKEKGGPDELTSRVHYMKGEDPGGLVFASSASILAASKNQELAQRFVAWLADPDGGQAVLAMNSPQYPLAEGVESSYGLPPFSDLEPPVFDQGSLKDSAKAVELILEAGII